jgi:CheW-like domain
MAGRKSTCEGGDIAGSEFDLYQGGRITIFGTHRDGPHIELEICGCMPLKAIENAPPSIRGAIWLNGKCIPVYDPHIEDGQDPHLITRDTCILLGTRRFGKRELKMGRLCDNVSQVLELTVNNSHSRAS